MNIHDLFVMHAKHVHAWLRRMGASANEAEDLIQDIFLTAHTKQDSYQSRGSQKAWIYGIAFRTWSNYRRRFYRHREYSMPPESLDHTPQTYLTPHDAYLTSEYRTHIESQLQKTTETQRQCWIMRDLQNKSISDIAEALSIGQSTVYQHVAFVREKLSHIPQQDEALITNTQPAWFITQLSLLQRNVEASAATAQAATLSASSQVLQSWGLLKVGALSLGIGASAILGSTLLSSPQESPSVKPNSATPQHAHTQHTQEEKQEAAPVPQPSMLTKVVEKEPKQDGNKKQQLKPAAKPKSLKAKVSETLQLTQARTLLKSQPKKSLTQLRRYLKDYPQGNMRQEAYAMMIEAYVLAGQEGRALQAFERFKTRYNNAVQTPKLERLTRSKIQTP